MAAAGSCRACINCWLALDTCREAEERSIQDQSKQAVCWREERAALLDRVALLEDSLAASSASAAAAAEADPTGCPAFPAADLACVLVRVAHHMTTNGVQMTDTASRCLHT